MMKGSLSRTQAALFACYYRGLSLPQAARRLGLSTGYVHRQTIKLWEKGLVTWEYGKRGTIRSRYAVVNPTLFRSLDEARET